MFIISVKYGEVKLPKIINNMDNGLTRNPSWQWNEYSLSKPPTDMQCIIIIIMSTMSCY